MTSETHKNLAVKSISLAVMTLSSTRTLADDKSGGWIKEEAIRAGHQVVYHQVIPDDREQIIETVRAVITEHHPQAILMTGGTGVSPKDVTVEALLPLFDKELTGFGSLFAWLSFQEIGSAAILSRATAGIIGKTVVFCMPGSLKACQLACSTLIFPELGHLTKHIVEG